MIRTTAIALLGLAALTASASAAEFKVDTRGKSPAQIEAAIVTAAEKACARAYEDDALAIYKRPGCITDATQAALARVPTAETAMNTVKATTTR